MSDQPEFSHPVRIDTIGAAPRQVSIGASEAERKALAERFGLVAVDQLSAEAEVKRHGEEIRAEGKLSAAVVQSCVITGDPVPARVEESFSLVFRPHPEANEEEEIELSEGELDVTFYSGSFVDLGEAVAESLSLSLDPYPRSQAAEAALQEAGVKSEEEQETPPGPLAGLKDLLAGKKG